MPVNKLIQAQANTWVSVTEMPTGMLALEGFREDPESEGNYFVTRIIFSKEAIEKLIPLMREWLDEVNDRGPF